MVFHSFAYLLFFPIVFIIYFLIPKKVRFLWLLATSLFFYGCADVRYVILLLAVTLLAYSSGLALEKAKDVSLSKGIFAKAVNRFHARMPLHSTGITISLQAAL